MKIYIILKQQGLFVDATTNEHKAAQIKANTSLDLGLAGESDTRVYIEERNIE